jgi:hypothetical protein
MRHSTRKALRNGSHSRKRYDRRSRAMRILNAPLLAYSICLIRHRFSQRCRCGSRKPTLRPPPGQLQADRGTLRSLPGSDRPRGRRGDGPPVKSKMLVVAGRVRRNDKLRWQRLAETRVHLLPRQAAGRACGSSQHIGLEDHVRSRIVARLLFAVPECMAAGCRLGPSRR